MAADQSGQDLAAQLQQERAGLLDHLAALSKQNEYDKVLKIVLPMLYEDPDDAAALFYAGTVLNNTGKEEIAYYLLQRASLLRPDRPEIWQNVGHNCDKLWRYEQAAFCYFRAHALSPNDPETLASLASAYVGMGKVDLAVVYADRSLELDQDNQIAQVNKGFAHLQRGEWEEGWKGYEAMLGHHSKRRKATAYTTPPKLWDGESAETVVVYGEQGIGDEIMFASCIPDALQRAKKVIIDCTSKLQGLFRRSFPEADVYGTRLEDISPWLTHYNIDSSIAIGSLPAKYRQHGEFPRTPYLKADPERRRMYRALLDGLPGKKIGISWAGGNTLGGLRKLELDRLKSLVNAFPQVSWVNLNYKDVDTYGLPIHTWKYAVQTNDYDDTAALVAELDLVISVPQAVVHLAGAIGVEAWCMTPDVTRWIYGQDEEQHNWYGSVRLFRGWNTISEQVATELKRWLGESNG